MKRDWSEKYLKDMERIKVRYNKIANEDFLKWNKTMSGEDKALRYKAVEFEERYFKDMTLQAYEKIFTKYKIKNPVTGKWFAQKTKFYYDLGMSNWIIRYDDNLDAQGMCEWPIKRISIKSNQKDENLILSHELIHAFEFILKETHEYYWQYVTLRLYDKLKKKVKNLLKLINVDLHTHFIAHSPLFMLKSIDLDIRLKKPHGTVYSYGRVDMYTERRKK